MKLIQCMALLLTCAATAAATTATAQDDALPLPPLVPGEFQVGCPWYQAYDYQTRNYAFPETDAAYWIAALPSRPAAGSELVVSGYFPQARYFSFTVYDGKGNYIDDIPDALVAPQDDPELLAPSVAALPPAAGRGLRYRVTVKFENAPSLREANTVYAGVPKLTEGKVQRRRLLMFRTYLPDAGASPSGNMPLPDLVLHDAGGAHDLNRTPDVAACQAVEAAADQAAQRRARNPDQQLGVAAGPPRFQVYHSELTRLVGADQFRNGDVDYLSARTGLHQGDLVVVRARAPSYPLRPGQIPDERYWSVCQNAYDSTRVVQCTADRNTVVQDDGYFVFVIASADKYAQLLGGRSYAARYNWLPWGDEATGVVILRQLLVNPGFAGSYKNRDNLSLAQQLGSWDPQISYCSTATFIANAGLAGQALLAACRKSSAIPLPLH